MERLLIWMMSTDGHMELLMTCFCNFGTWNSLCCAYGFLGPVDTPILQVLGYEDDGDYGMKLHYSGTGDSFVNISFPKSPNTPLKMET